MIILASGQCLSLLHDDKIKIKNTILLFKKKKTPGQLIYLPDFTVDTVASLNQLKSVKSNFASKSYLSTDILSGIYTFAREYTIYTLCFNITINYQLMNETRWHTLPKTHAPPHGVFCT